MEAVRKRRRAVKRRKSRRRKKKNLNTRRNTKRGARTIGSQLIATLKIAKMVKMQKKEKILSITKKELLLRDQNQTRLTDRLTMEVIIEVIMIDQVTTIPIITKTTTDLTITEDTGEDTTIEIIEDSKTEVMEIIIKDGVEEGEVTEMISGETEDKAEVVEAGTETTEIIGTITEIILMKTPDLVIKDMKRIEIPDQVTIMKTLPDPIKRIPSQVIFMRRSREGEMSRMTPGRKEKLKEMTHEMPVI